MHLQDIFFNSLGDFDIKVRYFLHFEQAILL